MELILSRNRTNTTPLFIQDYHLWEKEEEGAESGHVLWNYCAPSSYAGDEYCV